MGKLITKLTLLVVCVVLFVVELIRTFIRQNEIFEATGLIENVVPAVALKLILLIFAVLCICFEWHLIMMLMLVYSVVGLTYFLYYALGTGNLLFLPFVLILAVISQLLWRLGVHIRDLQKTPTDPETGGGSSEVSNKHSAQAMYAL